MERVRYNTMQGEAVQLQWRVVRVQSCDLYINRHAQYTSNGRAMYRVYVELYVQDDNQ